jgi:hypothetical protein
VAAAAAERAIRLPSPALSGCRLSLRVSHVPRAWCAWRRWLFWRYCSERTGIVLVPEAAEVVNSEQRITMCGRDFASLAPSIARASGSGMRRASPLRRLVELVQLMTSRWCALTLKSRHPDAHCGRMRHTSTQKTRDRICSSSGAWPDSAKPPRGKARRSSPSSSSAHRRLTTSVCRRLAG